MLAFLIGGLLLSAVQGSQSQSSLTQTADSTQSAANFQRLIQRPLDEMVPFDGMSPRFWFGQGYRQAFQHMIQMYEEPTTQKGLNIYQVLNLTSLFLSFVYTCWFHFIGLNGAS